VEWGTPQALFHPVALDQSFDFAKVLLKKYKLGQNNVVPDVLLLSLSNHDVGGHIFGPDAAESQEIMLYEDRKISEFLEFLQRHVSGGLEKVWIVLTADHGVAPLVETAKSLGLNSGRIELKTKISDWNNELKSKFDYCSEDWIIESKSFHLYLNQECLNKNVEKSYLVQKQIMTWINSIEGVETVVICDTNRVTLHFIPPDIEKRLKMSCVPGVSGQLIVVPKPFWYEQGPPATHMTHYAYDRTVPVVFWGKPFRPGVIQSDVSVLDISSTLLYGLGIFPTAQAEGKVLYQVFKK
jgi:predicted AlkP superfamily pyrophosphatase or phosphodiesterase